MELLDFSLNSKQITQKLTEYFKSANSVYESIEKQYSTVEDKDISKCTFESILVPLLDDDSKSWSYFTNCCFPSDVSTDKSIREASVISKEKYDNFIIEKFTKKGLFQAINNIKKNEAHFKTLNKLQKRAIEFYLKKFKRNGMNLKKEEDLKKYIKLMKKVSKNQIEYCQNLGEFDGKLYFQKQELVNCSESFLKSLKTTTTNPSKPQNSDKDKNKDKQIEYYIVDIDKPSMKEILNNCSNSETRKKMYIASRSKVFKRNTEIVDETIPLRYEISQVLGYDSYSQYSLENKMAKNDKNVFDFLLKLRNKLLPLAKHELSLLKQLKLLKEPNSKDFYMWDFNYYDSLYKQINFKFDQKEMKKYFPLEKTFDKVMKIIQNIYGLKFIEKKQNEFNEKDRKRLFWEENVQLFFVFDSKTNQQIGSFYVDPYPREGKYTHMAAFDLIPGFQSFKNEKIKSLPVVGLIGNFPKPQNDKIPALLSVDDLRSLLHEFGHLIHYFCCKSKYSIFNSFETEIDFVEIVSQFHENFLVEKESLKYFSGHYENNSKIDDENIENMIKSKSFGQPLFYLQLIHKATFDLLSHSTLKNPIQDKYKFKNYENKKDYNSTLISETLEKDFNLITHDGSKEAKNCNYSCWFEHLMCGYESSYYSYLWSEVISCAFFQYYKSKNIFDEEMGKKLRKTVYEIGSEKDGMEIVKDFLGKSDLDIDSFLKMKNFILKE